MEVKIMDKKIDEIIDRLNHLKKEIIRLSLEQENDKNPGLFDTDRDIDEIIEENPGILN